MLKINKNQSLQKKQNNSFNSQSAMQLSQTPLMQLKEQEHQELFKATPIQKPNNTGLPNKLKNGMESLTGVSLDSVNVHYNSNEPAQLNAHAFAQGSDIYLASGQEKHLPHELGHVIQQAQGKVRATKNVHGSSINDNQSLEKEASKLGRDALQMSTDFINSEELLALPTNTPIQRMIDKDISSVEAIKNPEPLTSEEQIKKALLHYLYFDKNINKRKQTFEEVITEFMRLKPDQKIAKLLEQDWSYINKYVISLSKDKNIDISERSFDFFTSNLVRNYAQALTSVDASEHFKKPSKGEDINFKEMVQNKIIELEHEVFKQKQEEKQSAKSFYEELAKKFNGRKHASYDLVDYNKTEANAIHSTYEDFSKNFKALGAQKGTSNDKDLLISVIKHSTDLVNTYESQTPSHPNKKGIKPSEEFEATVPQSKLSQEIANAIRKEYLKEDSTRFMLGVLVLPSGKVYVSHSGEKEYIKDTFKEVIAEVAKKYGGLTFEPAIYNYANLKSKYEAELKGMALPSGHKLNSNKVECTTAGHEEVGNPSGVCAAPQAIGTPDGKNITSEDLKADKAHNYLISITEVYVGKQDGKDKKVSVKDKDGTPQEYGGNKDVASCLTCQHQLQGVLKKLKQRVQEADEIESIEADTSYTKTLTSLAAFITAVRITKEKDRPIPLTTLQQTQKAIVEKVEALKNARINNSYYLDNETILANKKENKKIYFFRANVQTKLVDPMKKENKFKFAKHLIKKVVTAKDIAAAKVAFNDFKAKIENIKELKEFFKEDVNKRILQETESILMLNPTDVFTKNPVIEKAEKELQKALDTALKALEKQK